MMTVIIKGSSRPTTTVRNAPLRRTDRSTGYRCPAFRVFESARKLANHRIPRPSSDVQPSSYNQPMHRRSILSFSALLVLCGLFLGLASLAQDSNKRGRKYKAPPPTAKIEVSVLRDKDSKPIENAAVIFHTLKEKGNMELKSNEDGKALIEVLEIGETVRLQIIAKGYQTYGGDYKIEKDQMAIEVRMKRPGEQYSIYKPHPDDKKTDDNKDSKDKSSDSPKPN